MKRLTIASFLLFVALTTVAADLPHAFPSDQEIRAILADRIDVQHQGVGIVAGILDASGRRIISYGSFDPGGNAVAGDTMFEIGSATKVFTSLLLADAVTRGEVRLDDPVAKYLPSTVKLPERRGKKITLVDLATHTSGLPRMPSNMTPKDPANPYADYSVAQLYAFLSSYDLPRDIGSQYEYSNLGVALLGHVLARRAGSDYETLVRTRITLPLAMKNTVITLDAAQMARLTPGHDAQRQRVANWDLPTFAGAGALRSTANDLLKFLAANLGMTKSSLTPAMALMLRTRRPTGPPGTDIALGWHITTKGDSHIVWHNGGTGGYRSYMAFDAGKGAAVVVLTNMFTDAGVDDIGRHLLDPSFPLMTPAKIRKEIALAPKVLDGLTGRYELAPGFILNVTREGSRLMTQATGQTKVEVFAESPREFFLKVTEAQLTFQTDETGRATGLVLHQGGRDAPGKRIGDAEVVKERKEIAVAATVLERYVGHYQLAPNFVIAITREGDQLSLQATGQPLFPMFAEGDHDFFLKAVDAQVTFVDDGGGKARSLVLHQNGQNVPAPRIE
jgi:D-alanyl-D-alanine-carboxypeptidase/D-alanyl-D-alanine-endopeptidase